jgi:hypothetical protein
MVAHSSSSWNSFESVFAVADQYSMCGRARLHNLYYGALRAAALYPEANFVDCGVAAGGSSAVLAAALAASQGCSSRRVYCFDTFKGLPPPGEHDSRGGQNAADLGWGEGTCAADASSLLAVCRELGIEDRVVPVKGLFEITIPKWSDEIGPIACLHMDGDWYESTHQILEGFYQHILPQGIIQIDDYGYWDGCRKAVHEYFASNRLHINPHVIDSTGVWLLKSEVSAIHS